MAFLLSNLRKVGGVYEASGFFNSIEEKWDNTITIYENKIKMEK